MATNYNTRYASSPKAVKKYDTAELRDEFLIDRHPRNPNCIMIRIGLVS